MFLPIFQQTYLTADKTFHCTDVWSDLTVPTQLYTAQKFKDLKHMSNVQNVKEAQDNGKTKIITEETRPTWKSAKF